MISESDFAREYSRGLPRTIRYVSALCDRAHVSSNIAEDVAQSAWTLAWRSRDQFSSRNGSSFYTWVHTIALNVWRTRARKPAITHQDPRPLDAFPEPADVRTPDLIPRIRVHQVLSRLSPGDRALLTSHYLNEIPDAIAARKAGVPINTYKVQVHRALLNARSGRRVVHRKLKTTSTQRGRIAA